MPETVDLMAALERATATARTLGVVQSQISGQPSEDRLRELRYWGLGTPSRIALSWAVNHGGQPYGSDTIPLLGLVRDGLVSRHPDGTYTATDEGRAVYQAARG